MPNLGYQQMEPAWGGVGSCPAVAIAFVPWAGSCQQADCHTVEGQREDLVVADANGAVVWNHGRAVVLVKRGIEAFLHNGFL